MFLQLLRIVAADDADGERVVEHERAIQLLVRSPLDGNALCRSTWLSRTHVQLW
jgi:hypothetical protein